MSNRRKSRLDAIEQRLTGPKRIGLFGHRNVGKTTLLAMFYRQASTGQVPGIRLAAGDPQTAEYLAEKIAQIESGEPPAGTLAETELRLRLYHGPARADLIVKDYQGEHVTLGSDEPIREFFADCDAVLLCLDPEGSANPVERRRRQQEVEDLLEQYIERSDDATTERPIALVLTKYDRVLAGACGATDGGRGDDPGQWGVDRFVESRFGMTRHALSRHVLKSAIFAVSSYGRGARDGRPPMDLHPLGLERPLGWLAEQLESSDREQLDWLWDLAPDDLPRLGRCVAAFERRYPDSDHAIAYRARLRTRRRRRVFSTAASLLLTVGAGAAALAGYDYFGYRNGLAFERENSAPAVAQRWSDFRAGHPSLPFFWPGLERKAKQKQAEWTVKAAAVQVELGTAAPDLRERLTDLKDEAPQLAPAILRVEKAQDQARLESRWKEARAEALAPTDDPERPLAALRKFLIEFPDSKHRSEALALSDTLKAQITAHEAETERRVLDDLARAETISGADFRDLIDRTRQFLTEHPRSRWRPEAERKLDGYVAKLDESDIDRARTYSHQYPTNFATRLERYQEYLKGHQGGGRYIGEATQAKDEIEQEWDRYSYRLAYDHLTAHPDDVAEVARRLRDYMRDHQDGRFARDARTYLEWWEKVSVPRDYHVTLRRGEVESDVGKYLSGGGPDLGVVIDVAGALHGPSPVVRNTHRPIWDYTYPHAIRWKLGDPISIKIVDHDWSDSTVYTLNSRKGDPLAIRLLSGTIHPTKGGKTNLVFSSDFSIPELSSPDADTQLSKHGTGSGRPRY